MNKAQSIKWINENKGIDEGDPAYWVSDDQRFDIEPLYNHSTKPWSYRLHDRASKTSHDSYTVRDAKQYAQRIIASESKLGYRVGDCITVEGNAFTISEVAQFKGERNFTLILNETPTTSI